MYEAKRNGKRRAELYHAGLERADGPDERPRASGSRATTSSARRSRTCSTTRDAITIVFQPIMDLRTGRAVGYESLSRFNRLPRRAPDAWFAQAHRCGLGYALEAKAIAAALATPGRPPGTYLTVNLSPSSLLSDEVLRVLPDRLDDLVIEITENELVSGDPAINDALAALRARGARLAVDDTGAGYAGLMHVMRLQPDIIKLDRALTTGVDSDPAKAPLISSFVRYAQRHRRDRLRRGRRDAAGARTPRRPRRRLRPGLLHRAPRRPVGPGHTPRRPPPVCTPSRPACWTPPTLRTAPTTTAGSSCCRDAWPPPPQRASSTPACSPSPRSCTPTRSGSSPPRASASARPSCWPATPTPTRSRCSELRARGFASRLALPITHGGETLGYLEACCRDERPWSRFEIGRARIITHQLGPLLRHTTVATAELATAPARRAS